MLPQLPVISSILPGIQQWKQSQFSHIYEISGWDIHLLTCTADEKGRLHGA